MTTQEYLLSSPNFFLLAGPCVIEGEKMALDIAETIKTVCEKYGTVSYTHLTLPTTERV